MKNQFFVLLTLFSFPIFSQSTSLSISEEENDRLIMGMEIDPKKVEEEKFKLNIFYSPTVKLSSTNDSSKFEHFYGFDISYETSKTYHYLAFDVSTISASTTNGILLGKNYGLYNFLSFGLKKEKDELGFFLNPKNTISFGFERFFPTNYAEFILFTEFGSEFVNPKEIFREKFFSFGVILEGHVFKF